MMADVRPISRTKPSTCEKIKYSNRSDTMGSCPTGDHRWSATQPRVLAPHTSPALITASCAAATNDRPVGNRRNSDVCDKNTRRGAGSLAITHSVPASTRPKDTNSQSDCVQAFGARGQLERTIDGKGYRFLSWSKGAQQMAEIQLGCRRWLRSHGVRAT